MSKYQTVLVIDSAMNGCGAAVMSRDGAVDAHEATAMVRGQAEALVPMVERVLAHGAVAHADIDAIVTTIGPGAFTGLRIGMSTAKSYALALAVPVYGVTTLQALAFDYVEQGAPVHPFTVIGETKRSDFYFQSFDGAGNPLVAPVAEAGDDLVTKSENICIGDAAMRFEQETGANITVIQGYDRPNTSTVARMFLHAKDPASFFTHPAEPLYLRPADVSLSKKKQRVIEAVK